ncbi:phosphate acetyltransferase [Candidatus Woesearchaeota archaeon]|nr:phosphate acetyltransferase [Candidatus Woesearchaeota archaeon]
MILKDLIPKTKSRNATIYFDEWHDERVHKAVLYMKKNRILNPVFLGTGIPENIRKQVDCIDPVTFPEKELLLKQMLHIRKRKNLVRNQAKKQLEEPLYFGALLIRSGKGNGMVSGATHTTAMTILPALKYLRYHRRKASSYFLMVKERKRLIFADCALQRNPSSSNLAQIALDSAESAKKIGINPRVAFLSYSTHGSAYHLDVLKVRHAVHLLHRKNVNFVFDGELQFDTAFVPSVAKKKAKNSPIQGDANVFIFPNLDAGNIGYKIAERMGGFIAVGPLVQGLRKPFNDLSRGCSWEDVVNTAMMTAIDG